MNKYLDIYITKLNNGQYKVFIFTYDFPKELIEIVREVLIRLEFGDTIQEYKEGKYKVFYSDSIYLEEKDFLPSSSLNSKAREFFPMRAGMLVTRPTNIGISKRIEEYSDLIINRIKEIIDKEEILDFNIRYGNLNKINIFQAHFLKLKLKLLETIIPKLITNYKLSVTINNDIYYIFYGKDIDILHDLLKENVDNKYYQYIYFYDDLGINKFILINKTDLKYIYDEVNTILEITNYQDDLSIKLINYLNNFELYTGFDMFNIKLVNYLQIYKKGIYENIDWMEKPIQIQKITDKWISLEEERGDTEGLYIKYYNNDVYQLFSQFIFSYNKLKTKPIYMKLETNYIVINYKLSNLQFNNLLLLLDLVNEDGQLQQTTEIKIKSLTIDIVRVEPKNTYERFGYGLKGLRVSCDYQHWKILLENQFFMDLDKGYWVKNIYFRKDLNLLKKLNITETEESIERYEKQIKNLDIYNSSNSFYFNTIDVNYSYQYNYFLNRLQKKISLVSRKNSRFPNSIILSITDSDNSIKLGIYSDKDKNLDIYEYSIEFIKIYKKFFLNRILKKYNFVGYGIKDILYWLLKNKILERGDIFEIKIDDILLQSWVYNPVFNKILEFSNLDVIDNYDPQKLVTDYTSKSCLEYKGFELDTIYKYFINIYIHITKKETIIPKKQEIYPIEREIEDITGGVETNNDNFILNMIKIAYIHNFFIEHLSKINKLEVYHNEIKTSKAMSLIQNRGILINQEAAKNLLENLIPKKLEELREVITQSTIKLFGVETNDVIESISKGDLKVQYLTDLIITNKKNEPHPILFNSDLNFPYSSFKTENKKYNSKDFLTALKDRNKTNTIIDKEVKTLLFGLIDNWNLYNSYTYIYNKYLPGLIDNIHSNSTIYPCIKVFASNRGRIGTVNPNIHFTPNSKKTKLGKCIRRLFKSRPGYIFLIADWTAQELATVGYLTGDRDFIYEYNEKDLHITTALSIIDSKDSQGIKIINNNTIKVLGNHPLLFDKGDKLYLCIKDDKDDIVSEENKVLKINDRIITVNKIEINFTNVQEAYYITYKQRFIAKKFNFGVMYGIQPKSYSEMLQLPVDVIEKYMDNWKEKWSILNNFMITEKANTLDNGYCETLNGRGRRMFYNETISDNKFIVDKSLENSINFINSGTAADLLRSVIVDIYEKIIENSYDADIVHTMHDEIVIEIKEDQLDIVEKLVRDCMENPKLFQINKPKDFKFKIDIDICKWWDGCIDKNELYACPTI